MSIFNNGADSGKEALIRVQDLETRFGSIVKNKSIGVFGYSISGQLGIELDGKTVDIARFVSANNRVSLIFGCSGEGKIELLINGMIVAMDSLGSGQIMTSFLVEPNTECTLSVRGKGVCGAYNGLFVSSDIRVDTVTASSYASNGSGGIATICDGALIKAWVVTDIIGDEWTVARGLYCDINKCGDGWLICLVDGNKNLQVIKLGDKLETVDTNYLVVRADSCAVVEYQNNIYIGYILDSVGVVAKLVDGRLLGAKLIDNVKMKSMKWIEHCGELYLFYTTKDNKTIAKIVDMPLHIEESCFINTGVEYC